MLSDRQMMASSRNHLCLSLTILLLCLSKAQGKALQYVSQKDEHEKSIFSFKEPFLEMFNGKLRDFHKEFGVEKLMQQTADRDTGKWLKENESSQRPLPALASIFKTRQLPTNEKYFPGVGNGHIATVVQSDSIFMNGFYNGVSYHSHRAKIPSTCAIVVESTDLIFTNLEYTLDVGYGVFYQQWFGPDYFVTQRIYAHRVYSRLLVVEIELTRTSNALRPRPVNLLLKHRWGQNFQSSDINLKSAPSGLEGVRFLYGKTLQAEEYDSILIPVYVFYTQIPSVIELPADKDIGLWTFLTSISTDRNDAFNSYLQGVHSAENGALRRKHINGWGTLWESGRIDVEGNLQMAQINYASLYYLLSSLPLKDDPIWPFFGLSPGGLDHGSQGKNYNGHVFWDQDTWMFPPILMLHSNISKLIMKTRTRTLHASQLRAEIKGYDGAMFPWESAFTGLETSPSMGTAVYEQHITGDVAMAVQQYLYMTNDTSFLQMDNGDKLVTEIAKFWASRLVYDENLKKYTISGVMPPDEYHCPVNNSVYTNSIAKMSLLLPKYALPLIGKVASEDFEKIANNIYIPFDSEMNYHPEFDGYKYGTIVKQADAVLLGFPLMEEMPLSVRENDLLLYENVTDFNGPAMTWTMFSVGWLELKNFEKAAVFFQRNFLNVMEPFKVWSEFVFGKGAVNFLTGMGGYLQGFLFGYCGFRMNNSYLQFDPVLPPNSSSISITGLDYLHSSMNFVFNNKTISVNLTQKIPGAPVLQLKLDSFAQTWVLYLGKPVTVQREKGKILPVK